jgi:16S rRNA (cytidine1402-2'-O)-methyltransferase
VCRELTKTYEEVRRGPLGELAEWSAAGVRGEITVVVGGAPDRPGEIDVAELAAEVERRVDKGIPRKQAIADVAREHHVPKREVYDAVIARKTAR